jgi:hypothetical protein
MSTVGEFGNIPDSAGTGWKFPIAVICGSMRYQLEMMQLAMHLTSAGYIVLAPFVADYAAGKQYDDRKEMLDTMHLVKIDMAEYVYIVGSHIGESTRREIEYAEDHSKIILYAANPAGDPGPGIRPHEYVYDGFGPEECTFTEVTGERCGLTRDVHPAYDSTPAVSESLVPMREIGLKTILGAEDATVNNPERM